MNKAHLHDNHSPFRATTWLAIAAVSMLTLATGCSVEPSTQRIASTYDGLAAREMEHHEEADEAEDLVGLQEETDEYCSAMGTDIEEMLDACTEMMGDGGMMGGGMMDGGMMDGGMMDAEDAEALQGTMEHMADEMAEHCQEVEEADDLEEAQVDCDRHHEEMLDLLEDADDVVPATTGMEEGHCGGEHDEE